ncbi:MAG: ATP-binding protein [Prochloraceae cyanobacterium]
MAVSLVTKRHSWNTISFTSTLYLYPVLDLLLAHIPLEWQPEIRLGLQEALVNAAKHGNKLDPTKTVMVKYSSIEEKYFWVISDEGSGFLANSHSEQIANHQLPPENAESGRGLCILHEIFDRVRWNKTGTQLSLCKEIQTKSSKQPMLN